LKNIPFAWEENYCHFPFQFENKNLSDQFLRYIIAQTQKQQYQSFKFKKRKTKTKLVRMKSQDIFISLKSSKILSLKYSR
jgi:hypothetical protein